MPRSSSLYGKPRLSAAYDPYVRASIDQADGKHDPQTGAYKSLVMRGIETREEAEKIEDGLYASCLWHHRRGWNVSISCRIKKEADATYRIEYTVYNKDHGKAHIVKTHGEDQEAWPYSPFRFHRNYNA